MASTTSINAWAEELALSFQKPTASNSEKRRLRDAFTRKLRHHPYGRTNQFEVFQKLDGLEEKFQVLNHEDLSDALRTRRLELSQRDENWIPDALDLFLHLSKDPVNKSGVEALSQVEPRTQTPPPLRWKDVEADDPIDRRDQIWQIPDYSDFSSDEDEIIQSSPVTSLTTSPNSKQNDNARGSRFEQETLFNKSEHDGLIQKCLESQFWRKTEETVTITELQATRQILSFLHGLPTPLFVQQSNVILPNAKFQIQGMHSEPFESILWATISLSRSIIVVRDWIEIPQTVRYIQTLHDRANEILAKFDSRLSDLEQDILTKSIHGGLISLQQVFRDVEFGAKPVLAICNLLRDSEKSDTIDIIQNLFDHVCQAQLCGEEENIQILISLFLDTFETYSRPIEKWLHQGIIEDEAEPFFVSAQKDTSSRDKLWNEWYTLTTSGSNRPPNFLRRIIQDMFAAGKTAAFLTQFGPSTKYIETGSTTMRQVLESIRGTAVDSQAPFAATFEISIGNYVKVIHNNATSRLKVVLENNCGFDLVLDAFSHLYFSQVGSIVDNIESKIFYQVDNCMETWNDRFLVADLIEAAYEEIGCLDVGRLIIHSAYTSSRTMESRRRSVRILGALTFDYTLPWPVANIIIPESLVSYRRIALLLTQIRRAKYALDRIGYFFVQNVSLGESPGDQKFAQGLHFSLLLFVNTFYDHLTTSVIGPMTNKMRKQLIGTVDEMIHVHSSYVQLLEHACLTNKKLKIVKDAVISILDLCIRFSDVASSSTVSATTKSSDDVEVSSFMSALSRDRRRRRAGSYVSDSDDDEYEPEGYSTFILDEDTTVMDEIRKVKAQFSKHVAFLVAGLRGISRSSKDAVECFELLADRLDCGFQKGSSRSS